MAVVTERKPIVGAKRLAIAPLVKDDETITTWGAVKEFSNALVSAGYTPNTISQDFSTDDHVTEEFTAKNGGNAELTVAGINTDDEKLLFGSTIGADGLITSNKDDIIPYVMAIYMLPTASGKANLYKIPKCKFPHGAEKGTSRTSSGVTISTFDLNGKYIPLDSNGDDIYVKKGIDPTSTEGKTAIETWFGTASGGIGV